MAVTLPCMQSRKTCIQRRVPCLPAHNDMSVAALPGMEWGEEDTWTSEVTLPPGTHDFKLVIVREDGSVAAWEPGENRSFTVRPFSL